MTTAQLKTFIIYAHEDSAAVEQLRKQLAPLEKGAAIELWYDGKILPGDKWDESIRHRLEEAELVLLCVSVDFLVSAYIEDTELKKALQRHRDGLAHLVPIILRSCDWPEYFSIGQFQALPNKARPVYSSHFPHLDEAFYEVQQGIKSFVTDLLEKRAARAEAKRKAEEAARKAGLPEMVLVKGGTFDMIYLLLPWQYICEMVQVKGGTFDMGNTDDDADTSDWEKPRHQVTVKDFEIAKYPVTQKQWRDVMGSDPPALAFPGWDQCPVESVSWNNIKDFLKKLNAAANPGKKFRLPTEAEWEYAARGGNQCKCYIYSGSNDLDEVAWHAGNSDFQTNPVGQKKRVFRELCQTYQEIFLTQTYADCCTDKRSV